MAKAYYVRPVVGPPVNDAGEKTEHPVTPKFGVSYQLHATTCSGPPLRRVFASAAITRRSVFRAVRCSHRSGMVRRREIRRGRPSTFNSDSLWSCEVGSKNVLSGGRAQISASAYYIDWKNIQQGVALASCGFQFTTNLGKAVSQGFDLGCLVPRWVQPDFSARRSATTTPSSSRPCSVGRSGSVSLVSDGDPHSRAPWTATLNGQYDFNIAQRDAFVRFDYEFRSKGPDDTAALNARQSLAGAAAAGSGSVRACPVDEHAVASRGCAVRRRECLALRAQRVQR